jgi:SiaC family regulatory phosphoprotein
MEKLIIEPTANSPQILLDPEAGKFEFSGESRPENVRKFYLPVLEWMEAYTASMADLGKDERPSGLKCLFNFEYFNSTSAKYILDIFKSLNAIHALEISLDIKWLYEEDDEDMLEVGQEMSRMSKLEFEYIIS